MTPEHVVREYVERLGRSDPAAFDLVADHFVQHAAGPQGRDGLRKTVQMLEHNPADGSDRPHHGHNQLNTVTSEVVDAARESLVIGVM